MRFFETILSGAALVAAAMALTIDTYPSSVVAGQTYTITYSPKDNTPTTFLLRQGPSGNLNTIDTLTTTATGGSFTWTVSSSYVNQPNYALEVLQGTTINYSAQFPLTGGSGYAMSSAASSAAVSSAVSSAKASASSYAASSAVSAKSSAVSAAMSSGVASARASASIIPSAGANSTIASATLSTSATASGSSKATGTASGSVPQSTGGAASLVTSPLAAIVGVFAAFAYLA